MYCIFCYGEFFDKGLPPAELGLQRKNRLKICETFHKTVQRLLGVQPKCTLGKNTVESTCNKCLHILNNYCKLAFQTRCLQLRLNWETEQLLSVMKKANADSSLNQRFQENFIISEDIDTILKFRNDIVTNGTQELLRYAEPIVSLDKVELCMTTKTIPAQIHCNDITTSVDYVSDKENNEKKDPTPLKILSTTSLTSTNVAKEIGGIRESGNEAIMGMIFSHVNDIDKDVENDDGGIMKHAHVEMEITNINVSDGNGTYDSEDSRDLMQSTDNEKNLDSPQIVNGCQDQWDSSSDFQPEAYTPVVTLSEDSQENFKTDMARMVHYDVEVLNPINDSEQQELIYVTACSEECDTEHDVTDNALICHIPGCGKSFVDENSYQRHYMLHEGRHEMVSCSTCGKGVVNENFLRQHMKIHNATFPSIARRKWTCEKCNTQYSTKFNLRRHFISQHPFDVLPQIAVPNCLKPGSKVGIPRRTQDRVIGFGSLQRTFKKRDQTFGQRIRWRNPGYRCGVCEKVCKNSYKLNEHMRTHSGERPFGCAFCTWRFATKSNLKRHVKLVHKISEMMEIEEFRNENFGETDERPV